MNRRARTAITAAASLSALMLVACSSGSVHHAGDAGKIRSHPSPAMMSLAKRQSDNLNSLAVMKDTNMRMIWEDGARVLYIDRPSKLSPKPIP